MAPSPALVILNAVKNLVLYRCVALFLETLLLGAVGKGQFGCWRTSIFTEFTLSVAEGFRMTRSGFGCHYSTLLFIRWLR
jgi:hypothetical protein